MSPETENIEVTFANGATAYIETTMLGGEEDVVFDIISFESIVDAIEGVSDSVLGAIKKVKPTKATVEFGVEIGLESGQLTALIVKGEGKGNLKIALEWEEDSKTEKK